MAKTSLRKSQASGPKASSAKSKKSVQPARKNAPAAPPTARPTKVLARSNKPAKIQTKVAARNSTADAKPVSARPAKATARTIPARTNSARTNLAQANAGRTNRVEARSGKPATKKAVAMNPVVVKPDVKGNVAPRPLRAAAPPIAIEKRPKFGKTTATAGSRAAMRSPISPIDNALPTNGKPPKNQAGIKAHELATFRSLLLEKRRELVGDMGSMESEALQRGGDSNLSNLPIHMADMGTDNYEQEFTLGLVEKDRNLLREINQALGRIQNGTFGICEGTGKPIARARLEAQPWARHSIEYARKLEKRMGR